MRLESIKVMADTAKAFNIRSHMIQYEVSNFGREIRKEIHVHRSLHSTLSHASLSGQFPVQNFDNIENTLFLPNTVIKFEWRVKQKLDGKNDGFLRVWKVGYVVVIVDVIQERSDHVFIVRCAQHYSLVSCRS